MSLFALPLSVLFAVAAPAGQPSYTHPLDPLTAAEINRAVEAVRDAKVCHRGCFYPFVGLREPPKEIVQSSNSAKARREASVTVMDRDKNRVMECTVDIQSKRILSMKQVPGAQPLIMIEELDELPSIVRRDPTWQAAMRRRGITDFDNVHIDAWATGHADTFKSNEMRLLRALSFYRGSATNMYGRPVEGVVAIVNMTQRKVAKVVDTAAVPLAPEAFDFFDQAWLGAPREAPRPLVINQPQGQSFSVLGHEVRWQKWRFRFAMQPREGLVIYDIGYEDSGRVRSIMYRASLSEMVVPYGDPDPTWSWRSAFDVGEYGIGRLASPLTLGIEAPENAVLFDAEFADDYGHPYVAPRVISLYERDGGLLWKHYDINTNQNAARRGRELVISFITTVGNYDYSLGWVFRQDGSFKQETELTGIMLAKGVPQKADPHSADMRFSHVVAPGVAAPHHQHFFNFRLDFDVDGTMNSVYEMNTHALPVGDDNPQHNAMVMEENELVDEQSARRNMSLEDARKWAVINPHVHNALGHPTGFALIPGDNSMPYAWPSSFSRMRAGFIDKHLWVTRYHPEEMYAAGDYPNQSLGGDGLPKWAKDNESLSKQDVVLWYTVGVTHIPRPEEWPVMATAHTGFTLVPVGFFSRNPSLDVPRSDSDQPPAPSAVRGPAKTVPAPTLVNAPGRVRTVN